jgi:hypothetical protein
MTICRIGGALGREHACRGAWRGLRRHFGADPAGHRRGGRVGGVVVRVRVRLRVWTVVRARRGACAQAGWAGRRAHVRACVGKGVRRPLQRDPPGPPPRTFRRLQANGAHGSNLKGPSVACDTVISATVRPFLLYHCFGVSHDPCCMDGLCVEALHEGAQRGVPQALRGREANRNGRSGRAAAA